MISLRTSNVVAILMAIFGFYCSLTGLTPQNGAIALTRRTQKVVEETSQLANQVISTQETETPQQIVPPPTEQWSTDPQEAKTYLDSQRLTRRIGNSKSAKPPSNEATSSPQ
ncbi:MAG: hypothetical protein SW833_00835 [Cyanobacteriota bacterium]|nr:hypothetical protein [Cyanobacteriota bacterium]